MTNKQMLEQIAELTAENAKLKSEGDKSLGMKVSIKKALSVYGLGRWPVTLYKEQWRRLMRAFEDIEAFIVAHESELANKGDKPVEPKVDEATVADIRKARAIAELIAESAEDGGEPISPAVAAALAAQAR